MVDPYSPSDLVRGPFDQRVRLAGRVSAVDADGCNLADAFANVRVALTVESVSLGDLVLVDGVFDGRAVTDARLLERTPCPEPRGDGDLARFAWQGVARNLQARARALSAVRDYFASERFLEVETPLRVPAPGVDLHLDAIPTQGGFLITSPELHMKRLLAAGFPRVFQIARSSRLDELGQFHEPEFTMLEWYRAFAGLPHVLADTEQLVRLVAERVSGEALLFAANGQRYELTLPIQRITVRDAFREFAGVADAVDLAHTDENRYFELYVNLVEPGLARQPAPLFLWKYPANQASLARLSAEDPNVAERFELYVGGVELCNGFDELTDPDEQRLRFEQDTRRRQSEGRVTYPMDERFLAGLSSGMPRAGGNALGFDRLLMLATGARELGEVIAFPSRVC